jgi:hypothetical protein
MALEMLGWQPWLGLPAAIHPHIYLFMHSPLWQRPKNNKRN